MKKAFTTIELVVAVSLLAVVMVISGMVFKITIDAQRQASATAEIARNFRAITDQINRDFAGLVKDMPIAVVFDPNDSSTPRKDSITFFATGDFQSVNQYGTGDKTIKGNTARIHYGRDGHDVLVRKVKIYSQNIPAGASPSSPDDSNEFEETFLSNWQNDIADINDWTYTSDVDANAAGDIPLYFAGNVKNFAVQGYKEINTNDTIHWYPIDDPNAAISDFPVNEKNIVNASLTGWDNPTVSSAIKFTMTLYDSQGVIPDGKTFTYIVYIGE